MTMILCGWIVLILQIQSVFNCSSEPSDPCCPDEDDCCNDGINGLCCKENSKVYVPDWGKHSLSQSLSLDECMCYLDKRKDGMCYFDN